MTDVYVGDDEKIHVVKGGADSALPFSNTNGTFIKSVYNLYNKSQYDSTSETFRYTLTEGDINNYDAFIFGTGKANPTNTIAVDNRITIALNVANQADIYYARAEHCKAGEYVQQSGKYNVGAFVIGIILF